MSDADRIRVHAREKYISPARSQKQSEFSIRAGDIVRDLGLVGRTPAVCSALKGRKFLDSNQLRLVHVSGPKSGQSTTVVCTYQFLKAEAPSRGTDPWLRLRGALKDIFSELGGGEVYLRSERDSFHSPDTSRQREPR